MIQIETSNLSIDTSTDSEVVKISSCGDDLVNIILESSATPNKMLAKN